MADINLGVGGANSASSSYDIDNSVVLNRQDNETLQYTFSSAATNLKKNTLSIWFKRNELDNNQGIYQFGDDGSTDNTYIRFVRERFNGSQISFRGKLGGTSYTFLGTTARFRDTSAWYHLVVVWDTTHSTGSERLHLYLNGEKQTSYSTDNRSTIPQNQDTPNGENGKFVLIGEGVYDMSTYVAETHFVDGQALTASDFGEFDSDSGIWKPKEYTGTYGNNGFYLDFKNASNLGEDQSGNNHDFTFNNGSSTNQSTDTPTNNFCTPLLIQPYNSTDSINFTKGNTKLTTASGTGWRTSMPTISLSRGKWYFEAKHSGTIDGDAIMTSIVPTARFGNSGYPSFYGGQASGDGLGFYWDSKRFRYDDGTAITPPVNTINSGDILSIALDMDNNYVYSRINGGAWHNNGSADGDPTSGSSGTGGFAIADEPHMICTSMYHPNKDFFINYGGYNFFTVSSAESDANGYGTFEYAPPSGYYAICSKNLAEYG